MNFHIHKKLIVSVVVVLSGIFVLLLGFLVYEYIKLTPEHHVVSQRFMRLGREHVVLGPNDAQMVQSWMTFDYINHIFGLPAGYLQSTVYVNDPGYPHTTILRFAQENDLGIPAATMLVQNAVRDYLIAQESNQ